MAHREEPGEAVEGRAEVVAVARLDASRVHRHPHPDRDARRPRLFGERALRRDRRVQGGVAMLEPREEAVAHRLEHLAARRLDRAAQDRVMTNQRRGHRFGLPFPKAGAALDVAGEEGGEAVAWFRVEHSESRRRLRRGKIAKD